MPRIIYAWNYTQWGGVQTSFLALIREARTQHEILAVMPAGSSPELRAFLEGAGAVCEFFEPKTDHYPAATIGRKLQRRWRIFRSEDALVRHLLRKELKNSVIHIDLAPQSSFVTLLRLCLKANVFFTMHNSFPKVSRWRDLVWRLKLRLIAKSKNFHFFAANEDAQKYLAGYLLPPAAANIALVRDAINPETIEKILTADFDRAKTLSRLNLPDNKRIVLTVGQFIDRKGRWIYLDVVSHICGLRDDLIFVWVTPEFPSGDDFEKVKGFKLENSFHLQRSRDIGKLRDDILTFFRVAEIFVLPSYVEGVPIALLEAMALGLPCISTRVHGIPEAIESERTGLLIDAGDTIGLQQAILRMADDEDLRQRVAKEGQAFVLAKFDERESGRIALREYDKCFVDCENR